MESIINFDNDIDKILLDAGWSEDRIIDLDYYQLLYSKRNFPFPEKSILKIFQNMGDLHIEFNDVNGISDSLNTDLEEAFINTNNQILTLLENIVKAKVFPLGLINNSSALVFISEQDNFFMLNDNSVYFIGNSIKEVLYKAINKLFIEKIGILY